MKSRSYIEKVDFKDGFPERKIEQKIYIVEVLRKTSVKVSTSVTLIFFSKLQKEKSSIEMLKLIRFGVQKKADNEWGNNRHK